MRGMMRLAIMGVPGAQGGAGGIAYLVRDTYETPLAAGNVHETAAEPGPGMRNVADVGGTGVLIADGKLSVTGNGTFGQRGVWYTPSITRVAGRVAAIEFAGQTNGAAQLGLTTAASAAVTNNTLLRYSTGEIRARRTTDGNSPELIRGATSGTFYVVLRNFGRWVFWGDGTDVRLLWWDDWDNTSDLYMVATHHTSGFTMLYDNFRVPEDLYYAVAALASDSFNRDDGALGNTDGAGHAEANSGDGVAWTDTAGTWVIASDKAVASALDSSGAAMATVEAGTDDVLLEVAVTRSAGVVGAVLRYADGDNYLIAYHDGTNAVLAQVVGGAAPSTLITGAAAYVAGAKLRVHLDGNTAYLYYNDAYVNRSTTVHASLTGTRHGLYTTDTGNTLDDFVLMARYGYTDLTEY